MKKYPVQWFPWFLTILVLSGAVIIYWRLDVQKASQIGDYVAGIAAALAFLWLIVGYFQQNRELRLQREELRLQRGSLELQKEEIRKIGKYNALQQIATILREFSDSLPRKNLANVTSVDDLPWLYTDGFTSYLISTKDVSDPKAIVQAYRKWQPVETVCTLFIASVFTAAKLYAEATDEFVVSKDAGAALFIMTHSEQLRRIPFLQQYMTPASAVASSMVMTEPGAKRITLEFLETVNTMSSDFVDQDELQKLRNEVAAREEMLKQRERKKTQ